MHYINVTEFRDEKIHYIDVSEFRDKKYALHSCYGVERLKNALH